MPGIFSSQAKAEKPVVFELAAPSARYIHVGQLVFKVELKGAGAVTQEIPVKVIAEGIGARQVYVDCVGRGSAQAVSGAGGVGVISADKRRAGAGPSGISVNVR